MNRYVRFCFCLHFIFIWHIIFTVWRRGSWQILGPSDVSDQHRTSNVLPGPFFVDGMAGGNVTSYCRSIVCCQYFWYNRCGSILSNKALEGYATSKNYQMFFFLVFLLIMMKWITLTPKLFVVIDFTIKK